MAADSVGGYSSAPLDAGAARFVVRRGPVDHGPGVVVFDANGEPESISGAGER